MSSSAQANRAIAPGREGAKSGILLGRVPSQGEIIIKSMSTSIKRESNGSFLAGVVFPSFQND